LSAEFPDKVELTRVEAIGIARLLWNVLGNEHVDHSTQIDAMAFAIELELRATMPPWPTAGIGREEVIEHYRRVRQIMDERIAKLEGSSLPDST
jgi:hypothetical protein